MARPKSPPKPAPEAQSPAPEAAAAPGEVTPQAAPVQEVIPAEAETAAPLRAPALTVVVTGPKQGRRRAGRAFGPEPVSFNVMDLTEDEIAAFQADPLLTVEIIDAPY